MLCLIGSSAGLHLSQIPFLQPTGAVRLGRIGGEFVVMPTHAQLEESDLDLVVSGTRDAVTMIEGFAREMAEDKLAEAILLAHQQIVIVIDLIEKLRREAGLPEKTPPPPAPPTPWWRSSARSTPASSAT